MASEQGQSQPPLDYSNEGPGILSCCYILASTATVAVALRFWARKLTSLNPKLDDYLILSALAAYHVLTAAATVQVVKGGLGRDMRVVSQNPSAVVILFKMYLVTEIFYGFGNSLVKLSLAVFYSRVFPIKTVRRMSLILGLVCIAWLIAVQVVNLLQCRPLETLWYQELQLLPETKCLDVTVYFLSNSIVNCITDIWAIVVPIQDILKLQMSKLKKVGICGIFLLAGSAFAASLARTICTAVMLNNGTTNFTKEYVTPAISSVVEIYVSIIGACLPTLRPVYRKLRYGNPYTPSDITPKEGIVTIGRISDRRKFSKRTDGSFERSNTNEDFTTTLYQGTHQVHVIGQGGQPSSPANSVTIPLEGIVVQKDMTWPVDTTSEELIRKYPD
ncbi:hypothetical protein K449DRAFT_432439 [Hypoxylon sp. EC38]|nr:hypothetical protein K449DRAFT_432439 [Hypoxylon sp. EC38]